MTHLKAISLPRLAAVNRADRPDDGGGLGGDDVVNILDTIFAFVLELVNVKGKGASV